jgi:hypothetical protein
MRTSLFMRAGAASAVAALFISLGLEAALARTQSPFRSPVMRPAIVHRHDQAQDSSNGGRYSWTWRNQFGRKRWSGNGWLWNQSGFYDSDFWYSPSWLAGAASRVGGASVIVTAAPRLNDFPAAGEGTDPNAEGGCVIHKLIYDRDGKYVGERQIPEC